MKLAFIIGCARSGTSILGELIGAHEDVHYIYEAHEVWEIAGEGKNGSHRLTADHATDEVIRKIRRWFAERDDGRLIVEKCPRNTLRVPFVRRIFPEARLIHIIRDGRDVTCSLRPGIGGTEWRHLKPENWRELQNLEPVERCARTWKESVERAERDLEGMDPLRVMYEDLVADPRGEARRILRSLDLPPSKDVDEFLGRIQDETKASYFPEGKTRMWNTGEHARRMGRWREDLTPEEQARVEQFLGPTLTTLGYHV